MELGKRVYSNGKSLYSKQEGSVFHKKYHRIALKDDRLEEGTFPDSLVQQPEIMY